MMLTLEWVFTAAAGYAVYLFSHDSDVIEPRMIEVRTLDLVSGSPIGCADELRLDYLVLGEYELVYVAGEASGIIA